METMTLGWVDQAVFVFMLAISTLIGVYFAYCSPGGNMSAAEYLVGGRTMGTIPVALYISGITLLGYPAETYVYGMQVMYKMLSLPFMGFFFASQLLPVFRDLAGISLYGGGIKAVVWTDAVQAVSMYVCVVMVMVVGILKVGGLGVVWERGVASGRIEPPVVTLDLTTRHTLFTMMVGAFIGHCAHAGLGQSMIQRYLSLSSNRKAITAMEDQLLPLFVMETLRDVPGLAGLFISGVFSAALSSMSTSLNSMSAVIIEDWVRGFGGYEPSERHAAWIMRGVVVVLGVITVGLVFVVEKLGMVMQLSSSMAAVSTGPLFTLFIVGLFIPWCDTRSALCGAVSSAMFTATLVFGAAREIALGRLRFPRKPVSVDGCLAAFNTTAAPVIFDDYDR
ncbi:hypothetical protein FOCC_FOCC004426 [Frankliniella occidentalis]|nr:hypothetical protein FOCC_FOCC004426 [Frankliniella occidentalis]